MRTPRNPGGLSFDRPVASLTQPLPPLTGTASITTIQCSPAKSYSPPQPLPESGHTSPQQSSPPSSAFDSETDLGAAVEMHCGRTDSRYAARVGVRGYASSDETSISGTLPPSSQSASPSQTPSLFSTGSFHPAPTPTNAGRPLCTCHRLMQFGQFTQDNHTCDGPDCSIPIPAMAVGWHCEVCGFDLCINCYPPDFSISQYGSQHTLGDSLSTLQLNSASPDRTSNMADLCQQTEHHAAASGWGRNG
jgi:hypothetical protein